MSQVVELLRQGEADKAVEFARRQVSGAPGDTVSLSGLAHALMSRRRYDEALQAVSRAMELAPGDPSLLFLRTRANYARENYAAALQDAWQTVKKSEEMGDDFFVASCLLLAASCQVKLGQHKAALDVLGRLGHDVKVRAGKLITRDSVYEDAGAVSIRKNRGEPMGMG